MYIFHLHLVVLTSYTLVLVVVVVVCHTTRVDHDLSSREVDLAGESLLHHHS